MNNDAYQVVCFGETLWDFLPAGKEPGGAPMNVAFHLQKLGVKTAMISRVGNDELGKELLGVLHEKRIDATYIQTDEVLPTSTVIGKLTDNHEMVYHILQNVAWDGIQYTPQLEILVSNAKYFVFGSLAARAFQTNNALQKLIEAAQIKVLDINLRPPFYDRDLVELLLEKANIVKLNNAELQLICNWFKPYTDEEQGMRFLQQHFAIDTLIVTKGGNGASLLQDSNYHTHPGYAAVVADTVGSGDSFLAAFLSKIINNASYTEALAFANKVASVVTSYKGGCPDYDMAPIVTRK